MAKLDRALIAKILSANNIKVTPLVVPKELENDPEGLTRWCDIQASKAMKMKGEPVRSIAGGKIVHVSGNCPLLIVSTMDRDEVSQKIALKPMIFR